eukprot:gene17559-21011_t
MKTKNIIRGLVLIFSLGLVSGCEKNFLDINTNPNTPTSTTPELVLPAAIANTATNVNNNLNVRGNLLVGNWAQAPDFLFYLPEETYQLVPSTYNGIWVSLYAGGLNDYRYVETQTATSGKKNMYAISKIMQAYNFQLLTDAWGDIPFAEALQGTVVVAPKFDKAEVWKRFANTLKLRVLLRQSLVPSRSSAVAAGFTSLNGQAFLAADENAGVNPGYTNQTGKFNPLYSAIGFNVNGALIDGYKATRGNQYAVDFLKTNADPRLSLLYRPAVIGGNYAGVYPGTPSTAATKGDNYSAVGPGIIASSANSGFAKPAYLITAAESFFLQSEAFLKNYLNGDAKAAFNKGIEESFKLLGSTTLNAQGYYNNSTAPLVNWTAAVTANRQFEAIVTQKWIANNGTNGFEGWAEWRRTGFPVNIPIGLNNTSGGKRPLRFPYPQSELASNFSNVPTINIFDTKIFWEK